MDIDTLGEELSREMARVRDEVMPAYLEIGQAGSIALSLMRQDLDAAAKALGEQDLLEALFRLKSLREYQT